MLSILQPTIQHNVMHVAILLRIQKYFLKENIALV